MQHECSHEIDARLAQLQLGLDVEYLTIRKLKVLLDSGFDHVALHASMPNESLLDKRLLCLKFGCIRFADMQ